MAKKVKKPMKPPKKEKGVLMPTADGKGQANVPTKTPGESVDVKVRTDVPGGESKSGSHIKMEGPNSAKGKK